MECVLSLVDEGTVLRALVATTGGDVIGQATEAGPSNARFIRADGLARRLHALLTPDHEPTAIDRYAIAGFASQVFEAAAQGDEVAHDILDEAGRDLAAMALALVNDLELVDAPFSVLPSGSVFRMRGPSLEAF